MVNFSWGNQNLSLPKNKNMIFTLMKDYIRTGDKNFRTKMRTAKRSVEGSDVNSQEFKQEMKKIFEEVLAEPLVPQLQEDKDGWKMFSKLKDKKTDNVFNLQYIENKKLSDLLDRNVLGRLKGTDVSFIRGGQVTLPPFDFDDYHSALPIKESENQVSYDIIFRESSRNDVFTFSHDTKESPLKAHIEAVYPAFDPSDLANKKADHILEQTGQENKFLESPSKSTVTTESIDYSFKVPDSFIKKLKSGVNNYVIEQELSKDKDGNEVYSEKGQKINFDSDTEKEINAITVSQAISALDRTDTMKEEDIIKLNDKYYYFHYGNVDSSKRARLNFEGEGQGTPEDFIKSNQQLIKKIIEPYLTDPEKVFSVKLYGQIKTESKVKNTYRQYGLSMQGSKNEDFLTTMDGKTRLSVDDIKRQSDMAFSHKTERTENFTNIETGEKVPSSDYRKLSQEEKKKYSNKKFISEKQYQGLSSSEKKNYNSEIRLYDIDSPAPEEPSSSGKTQTRESTDFGYTQYRPSQVTADEIQEVFEDATVLLTFEVIKLGEFNLSGARVKQNRSMATHTNKLKKNIRKIKRSIGE